MHILGIVFLSLVAIAALGWVVFLFAQAPAIMRELNRLEFRKNYEQLSLELSRERRQRREREQNQRAP